MSQILHRRTITGDMSFMDVALEMSEGNPGAANVLGQLLAGEGGGDIVALLILDDMNIWGTQIWIAYKNFAKSDMPTFVKAIKSRDPAMIKMVNDFGRQGNHKWLAVEGGASYPNKRRML